MRPSLRFLALAVFGWAGVRAATVGGLPSADFFKVTRSAAKPAPVTATQFPEIEPIEPAAPVVPASYSPPPQVAALPAAPADVRYVQGVVGRQVELRRGVVTVYQLPPATRAADPDLPRPRRQLAGGALHAADYFSPLPPLDLGRFASLGGPSSRPASMVTGQSVPALDNRKVDRLQLSTWALLRSQQTGVAGSRSLATGGQLGASQAGARLMYNLNRQVAISARVSSEVGRRGGEVAAGVRVQPLVSLPIWVTAERRQALGKYGGGRSDFALFAEAGVYNRPLLWGVDLNAYLQGGVVGVKTRDLFIDGALTLTRPLYRNFSAGFGVWGGAQPGLYRVDAGPRVTMQVRRNVKVHLDWRQRLAGHARPGSGPALTLAGDF